MNKWIEILIEIVGLILVFLVTSYFLFYKSWLKEKAKQITRKDLVLTEENVKKNFNEKLEELKSTLAKNNISHQIEFEFLHKRRAKVAIGIHQKLQNLHEASFEFNQAKKDATMEESERQQKLYDAINSFRDYFDKNRIFFPESFCNEIDRILRNYWRKGSENTYLQKKDSNGVLLHEDQNDFKKEIDKISKEINYEIPKQLDIIEKRIRNILKIEE